MNKTHKAEPHSFDDIILTKELLPVLPAGVPQLIQSLSDDNMDYQTLEQIISQFPTITARLLYLANSSWAAPLVPVESLKLACARLGLTLVRSVSITLAISSPFDPMKCPSFDAARFWCTALLVADGSKLLASYIEHDQRLDTSAIHTTGLLHNLGLLWLADNKPKELSRAFEIATAYPETSIRQSLQDIIGTDYCKVGACLGKAWSLPNMIVSTMENHTNPDYTGKNWGTNTLIGATEEMVSALFKELDTLPENSFQLQRLNISPTHQSEVYEKLIKKFTNTRELARTLFST